MAGPTAAPLATRQALDAHPRLVLAVSGGLDSMTLLHSAAQVRTRADHIVVATFDHGTGPAARSAADLVESEATRLQLPIVRGQGFLRNATEAEWRLARWNFLREVAVAERAAIGTAHTRDDQIETVVLRILRDAGARGLSGLYAESDTVRPFLDLSRRTLARFAVEHSVRHIEDPSNASMRFARNRVRRDLLPAIRRVRPDFDNDILALAQHAALWRHAVDALAESFVLSTRARRELVADAAAMARLDDASLRIVWPSLAARIGIALDRRGTHRLATFTTNGKHAARIQVSGGFEAVRLGASVVIRPFDVHSAQPRDAEGVPLVGEEIVFGSWRFRRIGPESPPTARTSHLHAVLPRDANLVVRPWRPGDRMRPNGTMAARRVKRFFADARIAGPERMGWPVVVADDEIVWIPGVRRSEAATVRSGRPLVHYACERFDR
jgi:tRNA(Ile)-lysidine synthase